MKIVKRSDKVAFLEVPSITGEGAGVNYRMKGFKSLSKKRNPKEYTRQYVDEAFETTDIVGISISQDFEFDQVKDSPLHDYLVDIIENEKLGSDAMVNIVQVDFSKVPTVAGTYPAVKRAFALIADSDGDGVEAYTYTGSFKVAGNKVEGTATTTDDWQTCVFTAK